MGSELTISMLKNSALSRIIKIRDKSATREFHAVKCAKLAPHYRRIYCDALNEFVLYFEHFLQLKFLTFSSLVNLKVLLELFLVVFFHLLAFFWF